MHRIKATLRWDQLAVAATTVDLDLLDLERWNETVVRLVQDPTLANGYPLYLYQSTFLAVEFEAVDAKGRKLRRRGSNAQGT